MICIQSFGKNRPPIISYPAGVCIQLLAARIQNEENRVPSATMTAAKKCAHARNEFAAEQQHAEKRGLEEKSRQSFVGEQRRKDVGCRVGIIGSSWCRTGTA